MKPNKENIITDILIELERGTGFTDCFGVIRSKSKLAESTFASYWKEANERHLIHQQATQNEIAALSTKAEKERLKTAIITKERSLELLSDLAQATYSKDADRINAIKAMADLQGWKAPVKTEMELKTALPPAIQFIKSDGRAD